MAIEEILAIEEIFNALGFLLPASSGEAHKNYVNVVDIFQVYCYPSSQSMRNESSLTGIFEADPLPERKAGRSGGPILQ